MASKSKRWLLGDEDERFKIYHYEAPEGSRSGLWIDLRWSKASQLFTRIRSNVLGGEWLKLDPPQSNYAVAKRRAFELIAFRTVPTEA